jgi:predicted nucleotidyltransferase
VQREIEAVLSALEREGVRYLVVGGVAVVLYGRLRTTVDLDLAVELSPDNVERAVRALDSLGYRPRAPVALSDLADPTSRRRWSDEKGAVVLSLWSAGAPLLEVDLFVEPPLDFESAWARRSVVQLDTTRASVVSLPDLIAMKRAAGRPIDLDDVSALEENEP